MSILGVTVVIEWDNVRLSELDRARRMLGALARQAEALHEAPSWATEAELARQAEAPAPFRFLRRIRVPVEVQGSRSRGPTTRSTSPGVS